VALLVATDRFSAETAKSGDDEHSIV